MQKVTAKKEIEKINWYRQNTPIRNIWQAYENPSYEKEKAWHYCEDLCRFLNGYNLTVLTKNTFIFTAGFEFINPLTDKLCYAYITPNYDRFIEI